MSHFVATRDIPFGDPGRNVFAFREGEAVPAELVSQHGWEDYVASSNTKAAQQATAQKETK
ncbi:hypothetical protein [Winogradskya humida]|uniref:Uncharacterized protein n=1 Tax=Winogradskya humida TaxID=113566 RepID=A0ABQ4A7T2_9ACTN|nr:hypothetical protein [Actinoplanes humidus]GIE26693.1 hypothetical protein Ahu01nite_097950 [Actinoplanes humidus]